MHATHVDDAAQCPDGAGPVLVLLASHVLGEAAGHDDDVVGNLGHLLDGQVHQPPQGHVFGLEELCHAKEGLGGLRRGEIGTLERGGGENL